ncbi:MAG: GNAT family N-acetyltransferase, partial [Pseudomonadota bacterium]
CEHFDRFLYIDRVAVAAHARRRGLAATLYRDVFAFAATAGYAAVVAEINSHPPNPGSDAFHDAQGFRTVGQADLPGRGKSVRYVAKDLADHAAGAPANP